MGKSLNLSKKMRLYHRYLGFFLAGIMAVYAISGVILIFRNTDFLKNTQKETRHVAPNLKDVALGEIIKIRNLRFESSNGPVHTFKQGTYNEQTGLVDYTIKSYPMLIEKLTHLHKANTKDPLFYLNIFFGVSLLFFVVSSFWMFMPGTSIFKKGMYFTLAGIAFTLLLLFL